MGDYASSSRFSFWDFANTANRNWYCDADIPLDQRHDGKCKDLAIQVIDSFKNGHVDVMLGGGYYYFINDTVKSVFQNEQNSIHGKREKGDLIQEWISEFPDG